MRWNDYDTYNLRHHAEFEVTISHGLQWVPFNCLGTGRYSNSEMLALSQLSPLEKKESMLNLYEAVQLFQLSRFDYCVDVVYLEHNHQKWEHHKPGYHAVKSNRGCCSTVAAWVTYILENRYHEMGYLSFTRPDASGHVMNYIYENGFYFLFDFSALTWDNKGKVAVENGSRLDYLKSYYATGICFKSKSLMDFIRFHNRMQKTNGFEFSYFQCDTGETIAPSLSFLQNGIIFINHDDNWRLLHKTENLTVINADMPNYSYNWNLAEKK